MLVWVLLCFFFKKGKHIFYAALVLKNRKVVLGSRRLSSNPSLARKVDLKLVTILTLTKLRGILCVCVWGEIKGESVMYSALSSYRRSRMQFWQLNNNKIRQCCSVAHDLSSQMSLCHWKRLVRKWMALYSTNLQQGTEEVIKRTKKYPP